MYEMIGLTEELLFFAGFIFFNSIFYSISYIYTYRVSSFLPFISDYRVNRQLGLTASENLDIFRFSIEISLTFMVCRLFGIDLGYTVLLYIPFLIFNIYQYTFRVIYNYEPNFFNDSRLVANAISIVWHESKIKTIFFASSGLLLIYFISQLYLQYLEFITSLDLSITFLIFASFWFLVFIRSLQKHGFYRNYPNDIYLRYHFVLIEILKNIQRSIENRSFSKNQIGLDYKRRRESIDFDVGSNKPNIHFIFIESYGSFFYNDEELSSKSNQVFHEFREGLLGKGWDMISNFSESTTIGGQSWLTYSSVLYGIEINNNTIFENYLHDENFASSNSLLKIFRNLGYVNYNLNPISPIKGISVPYDEMRKFYSIDQWILNDVLKYTGDVYGWGECPPDQYAMNRTMEIIKENKHLPYTFFYLTKNSHSPFISPEITENWKSLNHKNGSKHIHKGFLKQPEKEDYSKSIKYQFENIRQFVLNYGNGEDIFLIIGDHQPPILCDPGKHGLSTPIHILSKNQEFLAGFKEYGFDPELHECSRDLKHAGLYSIFLREFMKNYGMNYLKLPEYEPHGLQL